MLWPFSIAHYEQLRASGQAGEQARVYVLVSLVMFSVHHGFLSQCSVRAVPEISEGGGGYRVLSEMWVPPVNNRDDHC